MTALAVQSTFTPAADLTLSVNREYRFNLANYLDRYLADLDASAKTLEVYRRCLMRLFEYLSLNGIEEPTRADIIAYRNRLAETHKPSTVQTYLTAARLFFVWTNSEGVYTNNISNIRGPKTDRAPKKDYLTADQVNTVFRAIDRGTLQGKRDRAILATMLGCGLRCIEAVRANIGDMRPRAGEMVLYVQGKGHADKDTFISMSPKTEKVIREYLAARGETSEDAPLFASTATNYKGERLTTRSISRIVKGALKDAGFNSSRLTAHSLRHTAVTQAILEGDTLAEVQQFARHADIKTTMIYNHALEREQNHCSHHVMDAYNID